MARAESRFPVAPGLAILFGLLALGMGIPAIFRWKIFALERDRDRMLAEAPSAPAARLEMWFSHGEPRILEALTQARFSARQPWIVSHLVAASDDGPPEVWGVDVAGLGPRAEPRVVRLEGLRVRVVLPAPRLLARATLSGDHAQGVATFPPPGPEEPRALLAQRVELALERLIEALPRDIPGARLTVEVGGWVLPEGEGTQGG